MRTDYPLFVLLAATTVVGGATALSGQARAPEPLPENRRTYYNHEFGFSLEIPFFAPACDPASDNQDTGITFFLDDGISDCNVDWTDRRFVSFMDGYNVTDAVTAADVLGSCDGVVTPTDPALFPGAMPLLPLMCRRTHGDLVSYALAGLGTHGYVHHAYFQTLVPGLTDVRYGEVFSRDLGIFRVTLASLRRHEPDPSDVRGHGFAAILSRELEQAQ